MRIIYIRLVNFVGVNAAMGLREVEFSFDKIDKPIIQIYGKNRCGKTVLIQQLHPFSSINLNGDERSDLSLIIPKEVGIKNIVYEVNDVVYNAKTEDGSCVDAGKEVELLRLDGNKYIVKEIKK